MRGKIKTLIFFIHLTPFLFFFPLSLSQTQDPIATVMNFKITTYLSNGGKNESQAKITRVNKSVRFEPLPQGEEFHIFDYDKLISYRVFPKDQIYFSTRMDQKEFSRAYQQGILPPENSSPLQVQKIKIKETSLNGHSATLYLIGKKEGTESSALHYSFVWEAPGLGGLPVRIADTQRDGTTTIIDFINIREEEIKLSFLKPPKDYLHLNPF
ncbi:MAG TPA: hypothetical protein VGB26_08400 [Nitrospiria bacterium]|jgi:hypothetical protein